MLKSKVPQSNIKNEKQFNNMIKIAHFILIEKNDSNDIIKVEQNWKSVCLLFTNIYTNDIKEKLNLFHCIIDNLLVGCQINALKFITPTLFLQVIQLIDEMNNNYDNNSNEYYDLIKDITYFVFNGVKLLPSPELSDITIHVLLMFCIKIDQYQFKNSDDILSEFLSKV